ncbi:MAG: MFS transporter [Oscillospiraceae bacterium]|nr:MFS transporter [Oscillospiraceae bacterium]
MRKNGFIATRAEHATYNLFWFGQNLLWGYAGFLATYLTMGLGMDPALAATVIFAPQVWDAVNDTLFGYIVDRFRFKNGQQFMPWVKIGTFGIGVVSIVMFSIPASLKQSSKIIWFVLSYIVFDALYTFLDAPAFAMATVMTDNIQERTSFISGNKLFAMLGGIVPVVLVGTVTDAVGWSLGAVIFCGLGCLLMIPYLFFGKERRVQTEEEKGEKFTFRQMFHYLRSNKYLLICLLAFVVFGMTAFESSMSMYVASVCFGDTGKQLYLAAAAALPVIFVSSALPGLARRIDKFYLLIGGLVFSSVVSVIALIVGYENFLVSIILIALKCVGLASWQVIIYMLVADTTEYGIYKSGTRATGITFSLQTFISKLKNAVVNSFMLLCIAWTGYDAAASAQTAEVSGKLWAVFLMIPVIGYVIGIAILVLFYKLRDDSVQTMAKFNNREITYDEAVDKLSGTFGLPASRR